MNIAILRNNFTHSFLGLFIDGKKSADGETLYIVRFRQAIRTADGFGRRTNHIFERPRLRKRGGRRCGNVIKRTFLGLFYVKT